METLEVGIARGTGVHDGDRQSRKSTSLCMSLEIRKNLEVFRWSSVCMSVRQSWEGRLGPSRKGTHISGWRVSIYLWAVGSPCRFSAGDDALAWIPCWQSGEWRKWRDGKQGD